MNGTPLVFRMSKGAAAFLLVGEKAHPTPGGNADDVQNEGVARKAIRKTMKKKGRQIDLQRSYMELRDTPTRVFCTKSPQVLKTKAGVAKRAARENKSAQAYEIEDLSRRRLPP